MRDRATPIRWSRSPNVLSQVGDLLGRSDVDWVLDHGTAAERAKLALRALEAGKNVAVESPPCVDARQLQAMTEAAPTRDAHSPSCPLGAKRSIFARPGTRFGGHARDESRRHESCTGPRRCRLMRESRAEPRGAGDPAPETASSLSLPTNTSINCCNSSASKRSRFSRRSASAGDGPDRDGFFPFDRLCEQ